MPIRGGNKLDFIDISANVDSAYQSDSFLILLTILKLFFEVPIFPCLLNRS